MWIFLEEPGNLDATRGGLITSCSLWKVSAKCFAVGTIEKKTTRGQESLVLVPSVK